MLVNLYQNDETDDLIRMNIPDGLINQFQVLKDMLEDSQTDGGILTLECPIIKITYDSFQYILEFCQMYPDMTYDEKVDKELTSEDIGFFDKIAARDDNYKMLEKVANVSDFLMISKLLEKITSYYANLLKGKSTQEMRDILGVENDFTPDEEENIKREIDWCEEKEEE